MPRSRSNSQQRSLDNTLRVEVIVNGERILISCGNGQQTISWLTEEVASRYLSAKQSHGNAKLTSDAVNIRSLRTPSGALLLKEYRLSEVLQDRDIIHAELEATDSGLGKGLRQLGAGDCAPSDEIITGLARKWPTASPSAEAYGHPSRVFSVAFSPRDSSLLATASDDSTAKIWRHNESSCAQVASFHGHTDSVMCLSWNQDGSVLATGSADTTVQLWKPKEDLYSSNSDLIANYGVDLLATLQGHPEEVYAAQFLPAGSRDHMLTASEWSPFLWNIETCQRLAVGDFLPKSNASEGSMPERWQDGHIFSLEAQPSGSLAAATCSDGAVRFWTLSGAQPLEAQGICEAHSRGMGSSCAWSPDGTSVASTATDGSIAIVDVRMMSRVCGAFSTKTPIYNCKFLPAAPSLLAICGGGPNVSILDTGSPSTRNSDVPQIEAASAMNGASTRFSYEKNIQEVMDDLSLRDEAQHVVREPHVVESKSKILAKRNLLCLAVSLDGSYLAASGEPAPPLTRKRASASSEHRNGHNHRSEEGLRSSAEIWGLSY